MCGPASLANVQRSWGSAATEDTVLAGSGLCRTGFCFGGLSLDELGGLARAVTGRKVTVLRDLSYEAFRGHLAHANDPARRYVINFSRGPLFTKGTGHHSPIGGYLEAEDLVFVLDVNETFAPWLVGSRRLFEAMDTVDGGAGLKRGLLLIE